MNVVFEGALSRSWGMQDVLKAVMGVDNQPFGVLRISSSSSSLSGRIAISGGAYIVGAIVVDVINPDETETGYLAVRKLLSASDGNFAFLDTEGKRPEDMDGSLYLSIDRVLGSMPQLPDDPCQLFDEKSLLDKVFGPDGELFPTDDTMLDHGGSNNTVRVLADEARDEHMLHNGVRTPAAPPAIESPAAGWARAVAETAREAGEPRDPRQTGEYQRRTGEYPRSAGDQQRKTGEYQRATGEFQRATGEYQRRTGEYQRNTAEFPRPALDSANNGKTPASPHNPKWQVFQPLIGSTALTDPNARQPDSLLATEEPDAQRQSLTRLRDSEPAQEEPWYRELLRESLFSKTSLTWIGAILILSLVAILFGTAAVNQLNSLTIHKSGT